MSSPVGSIRFSTKLVQSDSRSAWQYAHGTAHKRAQVRLRAMHKGILQQIATRPVSP